MVLGLAYALSDAPPMLACSPEQPCAAGAIDGFFMPLIVTSLGDPHQVMMPSPSPITAAVPAPPPSSGKAVIITPPPSPERTTPLQGTVVPVRQLLIGQTLFGGAFRDGSEANMFATILTATERAPDSARTRDTLTPAALTPDALTPAPGDHDMLVMEQVITLPIGEAWPLQSLSQPVGMQITCGACGPHGGVSHLAGTARLDMQIAPWGQGKITDIDLRAAGGSTAHGEMHFVLRNSHENLFIDEEARLRLVIDRKTTHLTTSLLAWRGPLRRLAGIFVGMPADGSADLGSFAGQFSGAECAPSCGVEN